MAATIIPRSRSMLVHLGEGLVTNLGFDTPADQTVLGAHIELILSLTLLKSPMHRAN